MIIGGAEDKLRKRTILTEFVAASGGAHARIAVIATASSLGPEVVEVYDALFRKLGAAEVVSVRPESREQAHDPDLVAEIGKATGVFMTGGNQLKLSSVICGTPFADALVEAHRNGVVIAGTSAGASIQSSHMVAFGGPGSTPKQRMTQVAAGLGLLQSSVIDQHFDQRNRYGRLLMIVSQSPSLLGIGVDEDTAAVVEEADDGHEVLRVVGRGAVTIFDPARIVTTAYEAKRSTPLLASGVTLHVLPHGARFDLTTRTLIPQAAVVDAVGGGRDRRGRPGPPSDGPRHRGGRRLAVGAPAAGAGPLTQEEDRRPPSGRSPLMTERPTPDLTILETRVYRGANIWSYEKAIHLVVDLGSLEKFPTDTLPGFTDNILQMLPGLREHSCSRGRRGGFVERLNEGTWLGHVAEHAALALQQVVGHDIRRGKTRQVKGRPGVYNVVFGYIDEQVALAAAKLAIRVVNHLVEADPEFDWEAELESFILRAERTAFGPSTQALVDEAVSRDIPVDPAQPALPRPARPGRPRQADPGHDDLRDRVHRGRHRLRQGPHHQAARRGRPAGAQAGLRAHGGPGGAGRGPDRLPRRREAARRQPRARRLPEPRERGRRPRGVPDRQGAVPPRVGDRRVLRHRQGLPLPGHRRPDRRDRRAGAGVGHR